MLCFAIHHPSCESANSFNIELLSVRYRECTDRSWAINRASLKGAKKKSESSKRCCALNSILMLVHSSTGSFFYCFTKHGDFLHLPAHPMTAAVLRSLIPGTYSVCYFLTYQYRSVQLLLIPSSVLNNLSFFFITYIYI